MKTCRYRKCDNTFKPKNRQQYCCSSCRKEEYILMNLDKEQEKYILMRLDKKALHNPNYSSENLVFESDHRKFNLRDSWT